MGLNVVVWFVMVAVGALALNSVLTFFVRFPPDGKLDRVFKYQPLWLESLSILMVALVGLSVGIGCPIAVVWLALAGKFVELNAWLGLATIGWLYFLDRVQKPSWKGWLWLSYTAMVPTLCAWMLVLVIWEVVREVVTGRGSWEWVDYS